MRRCAGSGTISATRPRWRSCTPTTQVLRAAQHRPHGAPSDALQSDQRRRLGTLLRHARMQGRMGRQAGDSGGAGVDLAAMLQHHLRAHRPQGTLGTLASLPALRHRARPRPERGAQHPALGTGHSTATARAEPSGSRGEDPGGEPRSRLCGMPRIRCSIRCCERTKQEPIRGIRVNRTRSICASMVVDGTRSERIRQLVGLTGFEPATHGLGNHCSIP